MVELKLSSDSLTPFNPALISQGHRTQYHKAGGLKQQNFIISWFWRLSSVQLLSCVWLFVTPWPATCQASLSITNSRNLLKFMSIESVMPFNHLILFRPLLFLPQSFPGSGSFPMSQFFTSGGQSIGVSALASVLPMNIQGWFPLGWTGWISWQPKGPLRVFSNTTVQKHHFFGTQLSGSPTLTSIPDYWKNHRFD